MTEYILYECTVQSALRLLRALFETTRTFFLFELCGSE
jgi:hypothetical protein